MCRASFADTFPDDISVVFKTKVTVSEFPQGVTKTFPPMDDARSMPHHNVDKEIPITVSVHLGTILKFARPFDNTFIAMQMSAEKAIRVTLQDIDPVNVPGTRRPLPGVVWPKLY